MAKQRGLTLLEMLVALSIMTAVMTLASSAYRYYVLRLNQQQNQLTSQLQQLKVSTAWQHQISAAAQYYVNIDGKNRLFFHGEPTELMWTSYRSMQQADLPATAWLGIINAELVYCEATIRQLFVTKSWPSSNELCDIFRQPIRAATKLDISYFGFKNLTEKFAGLSEGSQVVSPFKPEWLKQYRGDEIDLLPLFLKFDITSDDQQLEYWLQIVESDPDKVRLHMSSDEI